jgi:hypothetical protein
MASLLERLSAAPTSTGPVRSRPSSSRSSTPYARPPRGDPESEWKHDLYEGNAPKQNSLAARLGQAPSAPRAGLNPIIQKALQAAASSTDELSIKGASSQGNVVEVTGLVSGTTADDVSAIFKRCGAITSAQVKSQTKDEVVIRVTFKAPGSAAAAVNKFDGQPADGRILAVRIVGGAATSLGGRLGGADGLGIVRQEGSVDVLMEGDDAGGSKMRSDALAKSDPRAQVLIAPPGVDPSEYTQRTNGRGRRGGRGRGRGRRGRGG